MRFTVVYDACVLYPAPLRDFLMHLALTGLFAAKWSDDIHDEWIAGLLRTRPELAEPLQRTRQLMNAAVPDALVKGYKNLIPGLTLPDPDDRHVLAAAIRANAQIIVTFNTKDFPSSILDEYGVEALHPDLFVEHQLGLNEAAVITAAKRHRASLRHPEKSAIEYLETMAAQGLSVSVEKLRAFREVI